MHLCMRPVSYPLCIETAQLYREPFFLSEIFFRQFKTRPPDCPIFFGSHAADSMIVHTIQAGRFQFDCAVFLTAACSRRKECAVMVFVLSKIKCFLRVS